MTTTQYAFRLEPADVEVIDAYAKRLSESTKLDVSRADALRSILRWFKEESPVTMDEIDGEIAQARRERRKRSR